MKTIKQIISDADPRLKGVLMIMIVYVMVMATTVTSGATQEIKGYKETIEIQYQDGSQEAKDYLVRQDTVKNVLKELDVNLGTKDTVNKDMAYIVQSKDLLQVNRISEEEVEEIQYVDSQTIETTGLHLFTTEVVQQGQRGQKPRHPRGAVPLPALTLCAKAREDHKQTCWDRTILLSQLHFQDKPKHLAEGCLRLRPVAT